MKDEHRNTRIEDMKNVECIIPHHANALQLQGARLVDIRDQQSFVRAHVQGSFHLTNETLNQLLDEVDLEHPVMVMCYHGISSKGAAEFLFNQGFSEVYSIDGGFEAWRKILPETIVSNSN